jgi:GntR family transcriptional regulator
MDIIISNLAGVPIYQQIKEQVKAAIIAGTVQEGEMLPSVRQLARDLQVSVITTTRAYSDLEQEGFVVNMQGKGCFVKPPDADFIREQTLKEMEGNFLSAIQAGRLIALEDDDIRGMLDILLKEEENG